MNPYGRKRLPFPFSYRTELTQDSPDEFISGEPQSDTSCNWFVITLDDSEKRKFTSALLAGFDLLYPDEFVYLFQLWLQPTEFPNTFPDNAIGACNPVDLCQLILQCIQDTPELQSEIARLSLGSGVNPDGIAIEEILDSNILVDNTGCDNDQLFGAVTGMVDLLNSIAEDTIDIWNNNVNAVARVGDLIESIPIVGEAPLDDALQFAETILQDLADAYDSAWTVALRDEIRCELFCLFQLNDCNFSVRDAFNFFNSKLTTQLTLTDVNSFVSLMLTQSATGEALVYAYFSFVLGTLAYGSEVIGFDIDKFSKSLSAMFNDPDSDWSILCDSCGWQQTFIFEDSDEGWTITKGVVDDEYIDSELTVFPGDDEQDIDITISFTSTTITYVSIETYRSALRPVPSTNNLILFDNAGSLEQWLIENTTTDQTVEWEGSKAMTSLRCRTLAEETADLRLYKIVVRGDGTNPFL